MADEPGGRVGGNGQMEAALAMLAEEQKRLDEFQRMMKETSTTVESADKMLTATFDSRGELVRLAVNNTRYRRMAPAELAKILSETLTRGRAKAMDTISKLAGDVLPGVSFGDLAAGKVDANEVVGVLMKSVLDLPSIARAVKAEERGSNG